MIGWGVVSFVIEEGEEFDCDLLFWYRVWFNVIFYRLRVVNGYLFEWVMWWLGLVGLRMWGWL